MAYSRNKIFFSISTVVMFCLALYVAQRLLWNAHLSSWLKIIFCLLIFGHHASVGNPSGRPSFLLDAGRRLRILPVSPAGVIDFFAGLYPYPVTCFQRTLFSELDC